MKITAVNALPIDRYLFVQIETDAGITGLGESGTWGHLEASQAALEKFAAYLVGEDPNRIEHHWNVMYRTAHFRGVCHHGRAFRNRHRAVGHQRQRSTAYRSTICWAASAVTRRGSTTTSTAAPLPSKCAVAWKHARRALPRWDISTPYSMKDATSPSSNPRRQDWRGYRPRAAVSRSRRH